MPLGSSSAAPVMRPGPSCFSSGSRVAGLPAAAETAPSFSSFAVMAAVGKRRAAAVYGENPDESLNDPDDSNSSRLAQVLRQDVVGIAFLELGELALGFARLALGLELANVLEPLFRRALLGLGYGDTARQAADGAGALERSCGFLKSVRARGWGSRGRERSSGIRSYAPGRRRRRRPDEPCHRIRGQGAHAGKVARGHSQAQDRGQDERSRARARRVQETLSRLHPAGGPALAGWNWNRPDRSSFRQGFLRTLPRRAASRQQP